MKTKQSPEHKPQPMVDLLVSIVIPSFVLMKFSGEDDLGAANALILALAFPLGWGLYELIKYKKFNFMAIIGIVSVLLTGGIGLLQLDLKWLAIKVTNDGVASNITTLTSSCLYFFTAGNR